MDKEFFNPGKGAAVVRLKLKGLKSGNVVKEVIKTSEGVEEVQVEYSRGQFLYRTGDKFVFMNPHNYEQIEIDEKVVGEDEQFIKEGEEYKIALLDGEVVSVSPPKKIVFEVTQAEDAVKGDTATGATKSVVLENGSTVKVPLFIKRGEKIIVSTETGEYAGRA